MAVVSLVFSYKDWFFFTFLSVFVVVCFLDNAVLTVRWNNIPIFISPMAKDAKHIFTYLLAICNSPLEDYLFN